MSLREIWVVDFGSQYTQLITRKTRELGYSSEILTYQEIKELFIAGKRPKALVLSGGPYSVFDDDNHYDFIFEDKDLPILGICYGMQLLGQYFNGTVVKGLVGEYGHARVELVNDQTILGCPSEWNVWMSHSDHIDQLPQGFRPLLESQNKLLAGMVHETRPLLGLQFHPEVEHTEHGKEVLEFFYKEIARLPQSWTATEMLEEATALVAGIGQKSQVLCAFSGGVDSLVAATLAARVLGDRLHCFFVDNGLLRPQDYGHLKTLQEETDLKIEVIDAKENFLTKLVGVSGPEEKRKIIGATFIDVFEEKVREYEKNDRIKFDYLLQGTLYPDVIESISPHIKGGKSVTIKSHHNVGGLPDRMHLQLLEPLRYLFKDEVRVLGEKLNLKHDWVYRHPFPGPGIGVRVLGELTQKAITKVQLSDQILFEELHSQQLYHATWQAFTVLLPVKTVGVKGDGRAFEEVICLRMVNSTDGMTATWTELPYDFLAKVSSRITNEVAGITRVVYDITSKPPGTIEWE